MHDLLRFFFPQYCFFFLKFQERFSFRNEIVKNQINNEAMK
jgi:hypothetical protein